MVRKVGGRRLWHNTKFRGPLTNHFEVLAEIGEKNDVEKERKKKKNYLEKEIGYCDVICSSGL